jgi:hypothetical protein
MPLFGLYGDMQAVADRARAGEHLVLGVALDHWLQKARLSHAGGNLVSVENELAYALAVYGELTRKPALTRFGSSARRTSHRKSV